MAAHSTSTAISSGRPSRIRVPVSSGTGSTLKVTSLMTASVPQLPDRPRHRSYAGDVLHHPAAGLEDLAAAVDGRARPADDRAPRRRLMRRAPDMLVANTPAMVAWLRLAARERGELDGLEGQHLSAAGERVLDLLERRAGARRHHHLAGLVERDAAQALGRYVGRRVHRAARSAAWSRRPAPRPACGSPSPRPARASIPAHRPGACWRAPAVLLTPLPAPRLGPRAGTPWPGSAATWDRTPS